VARDLSPALDVADLITKSYNLEVSSPGVERALRGKNDYVRFAGKKAKLKLAAPSRGQKVVTGVLGPVEGDKLALREGGATHEIPLGDIESARLVFEWPATSPNKPKAKHGPSSR